jgi:hypothetical protein
MPEEPSSPSSRIRRRLAATWLWQAAFVRPFEDKLNWKKIMAVQLSYWFGLLFLVLGGTFLIDDSLRWPSPLDDMQRISGTIVSAGTKAVGGGGRGGGGRGVGYVVVATPDKSKETFYTWDRRIKLLLAHRIGQSVTVWWQPGFDLPWALGWHKRAFEVHVSDIDWYVLKYVQDRPRQLAYDSKDDYWYWAMLVLGLVLLVKPVWTHRKPDQPPGS